MTIFIDIDNVVNDCAEKLVTAYNLDYASQFPNTFKKITTEDIKSYYFSDCFDTVTQVALFSYFKDKDFWKTLSCKPNCVAAINEIKKLGHTIYFATATSPEVFSCKLDMLKKFFGDEFDYHNLICIHNKSLLSGDILIDDNIDNLTGFRGVGILFEQPWNKGKYGHNIIQAKDWNQILKIIKIQSRRGIK